MTKYKLIKKYPSLPDWMKEGDVVSNRSSSNHYFRSSLTLSKGEVENNPEYWEKVTEKDYQVISIEPATTKPCGEVYHLPFADYPLKQGDRILSVKRLSDGKIISLGDKVNHNNKGDVFLDHTWRKAGVLTAMAKNSVVRQIIMIKGKCCVNTDYNSYFYTLDNFDLAPIPNFEIVSIKYKGVIFENFDGKYFYEEGQPVGSSITSKVHIEDLDRYGVHIHSVKRNNDKEIFTVGNKVEYKVSNKWYKDSINYISSFTISGNYIVINCKNNPAWAYLSDTVRKLKPILKTEDGVNIYKDDIYYVASESNHKITECSGEDFQLYFLTKYPQNKRFSTKELAEDHIRKIVEEYLLYTQKSLSLQDVISTIVVDADSEELLLDKVKSNLK